MAVTLTNNGNGTSTLNITYTFDTTKITDTALDAAHYYYLHGYALADADGNTRDWATLTNAEKRGVLSKAIRDILIDASKSWFVPDASETARQTALVTANTRYDVGAA